jgi:hypothetical protein
MIHSYKEFSPEFNATVNAFYKNPPATFRAFHYQLYRLIPSSVIERLITRATPTKKSKQSKIRNVDMAGGKFVRVAFSDQLSQAG